MAMEDYAQVDPEREPGAPAKGEAAIRVLQLEDSPADAELIYRRLRDDGFDAVCDVVADELAFRQALANAAPQIILSDFSLRGFDGLSALQIAQETAPSTPFIFVSGTIGEERAIEALKRGATDYVLKDNLRRLVPAIRSALRQAEVARGRELAEEMLRRSESRLQDIINTSKDWIWECDRDGRFTFSSPSVAEVLGYTRHEVLGRRATDYVNPADELRLHTTLAEVPPGDHLEKPITLRWRHKGGKARWLERTMVGLRDAEGEWLGVRGIDRDVTMRVAQDERIRRLNRALRFLSGASSAGMRIRDRDGLIKEACRLAVSAGGYLRATIYLLPNDGAASKPFVCTYSGVQNGGARWTIGAELPRGLNLVTQVIATAKPIILNEPAADEVLAKRGSEARSRIALPLLIDRRVIGVVELDATESGVFGEAELALLKKVADNITFALQYLHTKQSAEYLESFDSLTGLANRGLYLTRIGSAMESAAGGAREIAIVVFDIEELGMINDNLGLHAGDLLLQLVAERLRGVFRDSNSMCRLSDERFAVMEVASDVNALQALTERLFRCFELPFSVSGHELHVAVRGGLAQFEDDSDHPEGLLQQAHMALQHAKQTGARYARYDASMNETTSQRFNLTNDLRRAVAEQQFTLHYQPQLDLESGLVDGVEALLRWPGDGSVPPNVFVPILESLGLIEEVGDWVIVEAISNMADWMRSRAFRVAVNVSPLQLVREDFAEHVLTTIRSVGGDPQRLELEITESAVMSDPRRARASLARLRDAGITIAIDDFGTGHSSLRILAGLPIDVLKIDRSFVRDLATNRNHRVIVQTTIGLAGSLGLKTVAEGVETLEQLQLLRDLGCSSVQGYLVSRPASAADIATWFAGDTLSDLRKLVLTTPHGRAALLTRRADATGAQRA